MNELQRLMKANKDHEIEILAYYLHKKEESSDENLT